MLRNGGFKKLWPAGTKAKSEGEFKGGRLHSEAGNLSNSEHGSRNKPEEMENIRIQWKENKSKHGRHRREKNRQSFDTCRLLSIVILCLEANLTDLISESKNLIECL